MADPDRTIEVCDVAGTSRFLATRESGRLTRDAVQGLLAAGPVVLDFSRVEAATLAFVDELVGRLLADGHRVTLRGPNPDVRKVIERALQRRELSADGLWEDGTDG